MSSSQAKKAEGGEDATMEAKEEEKGLQAQHGSLNTVL